MAVSRSDALVLYGVTGDLAHKMIFPALYPSGGGSYNVARFNPGTPASLLAAAEFGRLK